MLSTEDSNIMLCIIVLYTLKDQMQNLYKLYNSQPASKQAGRGILQVASSSCEFEL